MNILQAIRDPKVFAPHLAGGTWDAWIAMLAALFGLPMTRNGQELFQSCTGRSGTPAEPFAEAWLVCGRRAGKSFVLALVAVFLACFRDWTPHLAAGERGTVMIIAADRKQARVIMRYVVGLLEAIPMLRRLVTAKRAESIDLDCRITIEVHTASFRTVRGYSVVAAMLDEIAFWPSDDDSASPDTEVVAALRPAMAGVPGAMLLCASSPYARRGVLWNAYDRHFGRDDSPVMVWQAPTRTMNPSVPQATIDEAMTEDPARALAEYGAEFRKDVEAFLDREAVQAVTARGVRERPPLADVRYHAFVDPSGGSADSFTLAIGHREGDRVVHDLTREKKPPFSPEDVVADFAADLGRYRITSVRGDRYAGEWPRAAFRKCRIEYLPAIKTKSDLYLSFLPTINSGQIELLDSDRLLAQLVGLERRTARGGRESIDHGPRRHDDVANAVAGMTHTVLHDTDVDDLAGLSGMLRGKIIYADGPLPGYQDDTDFPKFNPSWKDASGNGAADPNEEEAA